ncbi:MAG: glutamate synthase subunit beta [Candidatus Aureabacteria bacterium]|nr:glutamate synthase subunit beta [Candidatus Auribacterota bacterium]
MPKDPKSFLKIPRTKMQYRPVCERVKDYRQVFVLRDDEKSVEQAQRCMDCGTPFCHWACPVGNYIPEWNELLMEGNWEKAFKLLNATNNLPEITGRVCPAPCEYACVLGINDDPVTIRENELAIIEHAFKNDFIKPNIPSKRFGKKIAVIGSGPAGIAAADQLNKAGHLVTLFEKDKKLGGILRYGIPDFKLKKWVIDRRLEILEQEGIILKPNVDVGKDISKDALLKEFDAVVLTGGSRTSRDLKIEGRDLKGIYFAMDYLTQSNRMVSSEGVKGKDLIGAWGKKVLVIGGGDTGSDCVGTAHRQEASCVVQIELLPQPEKSRTEDFPWPYYPMILKTSTSHEEGGKREWAVLTKKFIGNKKGNVTKLECVRVEFDNSTSPPKMKEIKGSEFEIEADLVVLAIGFLHPDHPGLLKDLGVEFDNRGNVKTDDNFLSSVEKVFAAGDLRRGQSLIVWAISEGRTAAHNVDKYLMGNSDLPTI